MTSTSTKDMQMAQSRDPDPVDTSRAAEYWDRIMDPQNLGAEAGAAVFDPAGIAREIELARTPDLEETRFWLEGNGRPGWIVDLGAGLGAPAFVMARAGHTVVAVDTSAARLRALRERARRAGLEGRIRLLVANAEALPFADGAVPGLYTKAVLIHTDMARSAGEIARVLAPGGRAALSEPTDANPFVRLYRATLAPAAWRSITRYFTPAIQRQYLKAPGIRPPRPAVLPFYFLEFFAFVFVYALPSPTLFRAASRVLGLIDGVLFRIIRPLAGLAWFGLIRLEKEPEAPRRDTDPNAH